MKTYINLNIENRDITFNLKSKYFIAEIKTLQDLQFDCEKYKDELVKQIHIDNIFNLLSRDIKPYMVLTKEEFENYCEKVLKVNFYKLQQKILNSIWDCLQHGEL